MLGQGPPPAHPKSKGLGNLRGLSKHPRRLSSWSRRGMRQPQSGVGWRGAVRVFAWCYSGVGGGFLALRWTVFALRLAELGAAERQGGGTCWEDRNVWGSGTTKPSDVAEKRRSLKPKGQIPGNCRAAVGCLHIAASSPRHGATYNFSGRPPPSPNRLSPTQMATQFSCPTLRIVGTPVGVSVSSRVEESLRDGPLDAQFIPVASGRPGS
jgi:hypothetical protein